MMDVDQSRGRNHRAVREAPPYALLVVQGISLDIYDT